MSSFETRDGNDEKNGHLEYPDNFQLIDELRKSLKDLLGIETCQRLALAIINDRCLPDDIPVKTIEEAIALAIEKYPNTPLHLLNVQGLREGLRYLKKSLLPERQDTRRILYAIKPNPQAEILRILTEEGVEGFDCASFNEVMAALMQSVPAGDVHYNLPKHSPKEIQAILKVGIRYLTVDHLPVLDHVLKLCEQLPPEDSPEIAIRIAIDNPHAALPMSGKFGVPPGQYEMAKQMIETIKGRGLRAGICFHAGSQIQDPKIYKKAIEIASDIACSAGGVSSMNIGGGLPVDYYGNIPYRPDDFIRTINEAVESNVTDDVLRGDDQRILFEFGRFIVAPCAHWISPVHAIERRDDKMHISYAGGVHSTFNGIKLHDWPLPPLRAFSSDGVERIGKRVDCVLSGESCNPIDMIDTELPHDLEPGDYLVLENVGAYTDSYGSLFNGRGLPKYALYNT